MQGNEGDRTDSGGAKRCGKRKGQEPGVITARPPNQLAAPSEGALPSCALQRPVGLQATQALADAQGDMQATSGFQSGRLGSSNVATRTYEAAKRMLAREALDPETYEACIALVARELGL